MRTAPLTFALMLFALPCAAAPGAPPGPAAASQPSPQTADVARIEAYLNGLTTAEAAFTLTGGDGQTSRGQFYLSRPSKLRFDYSEPKGNLLIADGDFVIYWDEKQQESSNLPISQTPLAFLLKPSVSLTDGLRVTHYEHEAGVIRLELVQAKDADAGSVTVAFGDQPLELRGWRLTDGQGGITDVAFSDWKYGMPLDAKLFHFKDPKDGKRGR
jgi:outer membrane lipoprotein-sorting protein